MWRGEVSRNIFVTTGGFAHILWQNGAKTLSKDPILGLFWRKNFVKLHERCGLTKLLRGSDKVPAPFDRVFESILWLNSPDRPRTTPGRRHMLEGDVAGRGFIQYLCQTWGLHSRIYSGKTIQKLCQKTRILHESLFGQQLCQATRGVIGG